MLHQALQRTVLCSFLSVAAPAVPLPKLVRVLIITQFIRFWFSGEPLEHFRVTTATTGWDMARLVYIAEMVRVVEDIG